MSTPRKDHIDQRLLVLWISVIAMLSLFMSGIVGLLAWAGGVKPPTAIISGGGAFVIVMTLGLAILNTVWPKGR
ncbi:hypothetical protein OG439_40300 [Amycolatopsis sp. NBC_01307]|uniref:hypothetical protein n=1 Tax=Amycolatopsis sp. NBC_01307 TaxID=2903561 RepID=UPI002E1322DD|nr:hypothetical protein OG439_40300 [Amycolatopsis sp. NBC_01307]